MALEELQKSQKLLKQELEHVLETYFASYKNLPFGEEIKRIIPQVCGGKLIRGSMILYLTEKAQGDMSAALRCAVSIELFHYALLVHDDVMDGDDFRRGFPTVHSYFANSYSKKNAESLAICVGDILLFLAMQQLNDVCNQDARAAMLECLTQTGFGQMFDVSLAQSVSPTKKEILSMYGLKTAAYTFVLPILVAQKLSPGLNFESTELAMKLGVLYQIQDDRLGLFGNEAITGKAVGADIRERKSTIYRAVLDSLAEKKDLAQIEVIYHSEHIDDSQIETVLKFVKKYDVDSHIRKLEKEYGEKVVSLIATISNVGVRDFFTKLHKYIMSRSS